MGLLLGRIRVNDEGERYSLLSGGQTQPKNSREVSTSAKRRRADEGERMSRTEELEVAGR
jgi:hypothetical protein